MSRFSLEVIGDTPKKTKWAARKQAAVTFHSIALLDHSSKNVKCRRAQSGGGSVLFAYKYHMI
jgi:hypothetical protein